jgi:hypothetical protein
MPVYRELLCNALFFLPKTDIENQKKLKAPVLKGLQMI